MERTNVLYNSVTGLLDMTGGFLMKYKVHIVVALVTFLLLSPRAYIGMWQGIRAYVNMQTSAITNPITRILD